MHLWMKKDTHSIEMVMISQQLMMESWEVYRKGMR